MQLQQRDTHKYDTQLHKKDIYHINYLLDRGFDLVRLVKILTCDNQPFTAGELNKVIFNNWNPEEVTLILSGWDPLYVISNPKLENPFLCRNQYFDGHRFFPPSKQLLQAVQNYENLFLKPYTSIALMIRSEHVLFSLGYMKKWHNQSLLYPTITKFFNNLIAIATDIGKYGSNTWSGTVSGWNKSIIVEIFKHTVTKLYQNSWTFEGWEQSFGTATGGIEDQSYVAAMQKSIASRAHSKNSPTGRIPFRSV